MQSDLPPANEPQLFENMEVLAVDHGVVRLVGAALYESPDDRRPG